MGITLRTFPWGRNADGNSWSEIMSKTGFEYLSYFLAANIGIYSSVNRELSSTILRIKEYLKLNRYMKKMFQLNNNKYFSLSFVMYHLLFVTNHKACPFMSWNFLFLIGNVNGNVESSIKILSLFSGLK